MFMRARDGSSLRSMTRAAIWQVLHDLVPNRDLGDDHFTRRDPERAMRRILQEANGFGLTIRFEPIATA